MASVKRDERGYVKISVYVDRRRRYIGVGRMSDRAAARFVEKVEALVLAKRTAIRDPEALEWSAKLEDGLHARLAELGLLAPRPPAETRTVAVLFDRYLAARVLKPSTKIRLAQAKALMLEHFGADTDVADIDGEDGDAFRAWLIELEYSAAKVAREVSIARSVFRRAVAWGWLSRNPLADVVAGGQRNDSRRAYVPRAIVERVLEACPDSEWRCIIALARFGGLRCPSEVLALRWADVVWSRDRFRVTSKKTEHHEGHGERWVPLFPEVRRELLARFAEAGEGAEFVVERLQGSTNLQTGLRRIMTRAGVAAWPRVFNNLRASAATDLAERFPAKEWVAWLGHSATISLRHYQTPSDDAFGIAAGGVSPPVAPHRPEGDRHGPQVEGQKPRSDGRRRGVAVRAGETSGRNRTQTIAGNPDDLASDAVRVPVAGPIQVLGVVVGKVVLEQPEETPVADREVRS